MLPKSVSFRYRARMSSLLSARVSRQASTASRILRRQERVVRSSASRRRLRASCWVMVLPERMLAGGDVDDDRAQDAAQVDAGVRVKGGVLGGHDRLAQRQRDLLEGHGAVGAGLRVDHLVEEAALAVEDQGGGGGRLLAAIQRGEGADHQPRGAGGCQAARDKGRRQAARGVPAPGSSHRGLLTMRGVDRSLYRRDGARDSSRSARAVGRVLPGAMRCGARERG